MVGAGSRSAPRERMRRDEHRRRRRCLPPETLEPSDLASLAGEWRGTLQGRPRSRWFPQGGPRTAA